MAKENNPLLDVLQRLDVNNQEHWTDDGLPSLDVVEQLAGVPGISRAMVTQAAPGFDRKTAAYPGLAPPVPVAGEPTQPPAAVPSVESLLGVAPAEPDTPAEPEGSVLAMPIAEVMRSPELLHRAVAELDERATRLRADKAATEKALAEVYAQSEMATRQINRLAPPERATQEGIQAYLASQRNIRAERAARVARLTDTGTTADELREALTLAAPVDRRQRAKPGPAGS